MAAAATIDAMADFLGVAPEEREELRWLAERAICAPLPEGWAQFEEGGVTYFHDSSAKAGTPTQYEHPNDTLFAALVVAFRTNAFERAGWELHFAQDGRPYFHCPSSAATQWTLPDAVSLAAEQAEPELEREPSSDSNDEELVAQLHAREARKAAGRKRRMSAARRRRARAQPVVTPLQIPAAAGDPESASARSSGSGSTAVSAQTDSEDEAFIWQQKEKQQRLRAEREAQGRAGEELQLVVASTSTETTEPSTKSSRRSLRSAASAVSFGKEP